MTGRGSVLGTLYGFELRMLLRDKRTILVSIVLPIMVMPLMLLVLNLAQRARKHRQLELTYSYVVTGEKADLARGLIAAFEPVEDDAPSRKWTFEEVESEDPASELEAQDLHFYIEAISAEAAAAEAAPARAAAEDSGDVPTETDQHPPRGGGTQPAAGEDQAVQVPLLRLVFRLNWDSSETASREMRQRLAGARDALRHFKLQEQGFPVPADRVAVVDERDMATAQQRTGATIGRFATAFLLLFLLTGGSVVAADAIAGEKERGTLETVLTTAAGRREIVVAKLLVILTVGVAITLIQLLNLLVYVGLGVISVPDSFAVDMSPGTTALLLLLFLPLAALAGNILLLLSGIAKTYKEFQLYFLPVFMLLLVPAFAPVLPGIQLRSAIVVVPVANLAVAVREVLVGHFDLPFLALAWAVSMAAAIAAGSATLKALSTERLITASDVDRADLEGGADLLPRHVWRWFTAMWVLIFLVSLNVEQMRGLGPQLLFNLIVVFLGTSLLIIRGYRLPWREALAFRPVKPVVWLAVVFGAPAYHIAGLAVGKLSFYLFPLPQSLLEEASNAILPSEVPLWKLLLLVAVLPAICEEITFRGVFLHALRRRFHPVLLCLVVGVVFALFHMNLVRLLPTAAIGVALTALTLLTGSIFPAMVWHAINNTMAIVAGRADVDLLALDPWVYLAAAIVGALAFALVWRHRTMYPDLRAARRSQVRQL